MARGTALGGPNTRSAADQVYFLCELAAGQSPDYRTMDLEQPATTDKDWERNVGAVCFVFVSLMLMLTADALSSKGNNRGLLPAGSSLPTVAF